MNYMQKSNNGAVMTGSVGELDCQLPPPPLLPLVACRTISSVHPKKVGKQCMSKWQ